ncbi:MAG TPA: NTP transferase domain-containing protein [Myxococcota bacterium]
MKTAGLLAAAGASSRMGICKALLPFRASAGGVEGVTFAQRIAEVFVAAGLDPVVVTVPPQESARIERSLAHLPVLVSENERPEDGLSGSVTTALLHAVDAEAIVLAPVDCPFVDVALVQALLVSLRRGVAAVPVVNGVRGHPVAFARASFELLWSCAQTGGPRSVLDALGDDVYELPWSDARICDDVDTPEDYLRLFGRPPI